MTNSSPRAGGQDARLVEQFLEMMSAERGASRHTLEAYGRDLRHYLAFVAKSGKSVRSITAETVRSCLMLAVQADGASVTTVEGLANEGALHPLQEAFREAQGLQCGFCTPGMLMLAWELLRDNASPSEAEIREAISASLCRCTGYQGIVEAVQLAAERHAVPAAAAR